MTLIDALMYGLFALALYVMRMVWVITVKDNDNEHK